MTIVFSSTPFPCFKVAGKWTFVFSHNYNDTTKDPTSIEFFLSMSVFS